MMTMTSRFKPRFTAALLLAGAMIAWPLAPARAQDAPPASPPATPEQAGADQDKKKAPPTLDELLGIEEEQRTDTADEAARRQQQEELDRQLNEAKMGEAFVQAIRQMALSADLLDQQFDTGLGTQRVQEDILAKLDQLIDRAKQQQQQQSSSSSSSSSSQGRPQDASQRQQDQQAGGQRRTDAVDSQEGDPPPRQDGDINTIIEETRQEWGTLPQRVRDMLLQGRQEKFSSLYRRLTEEYYRRLAEEGSR